MITTWYLQSQRTWDRLCHSCIGSSFLPLGAFLEVGAYAVSQGMHAGSLEALSSTFAVFWGFPKVSLLAEMAGIGQVPHLAQGGYHAHYNRPYPQAVVPKTTTEPVPCISTPTGSKSSCVSAADRSDSRPTAQTGPYYL